MNELEKALLSSLMIMPDNLYTISQVIKPEMFYVTQHQELYKAILYLHKHNKPMDYNTIHYILEKMKSKMTRSDIASIAMAMPTGELALHYAQLVREEYTRRQIDLIIKTAIPSINDKSNDTTNIIADITNKLSKLSPTITMQESTVYPDIVGIWEEYQDTDSNKPVNWITTGYTDLDKVIYLAGGTHTIIGASPSEGKTSLGICILRNVSATGKRVLFISMEQTRKRILKKIITQASGVSHTNYLKGRLTEQETKRVAHYMNAWANPNMCVVSGKWSAVEIRNKCIKEQAEKGLDMVIIDLLGLMKRPEDIGKDAKEHQVFNKNSELLQDLSGELEIPIITMAHLNRERYKRPDGRPILSDLREAGEQFADNVIFINRPYLRTKNPADEKIAELLIAKNRDGEVGMVELGFDGPTTTFYNLSKREDVPIETPTPEVCNLSPLDSDEQLVLRGGIQ